jgi:L,D-transpeptidase ErfK/SrfK
MLFLFEGGKVVSSFPVAVGRPTWRTTLGAFTVTNREENPNWRVPSSIQIEMAAAGKRVRMVVPPGPGANCWPRPRLSLLLRSLLWAVASRR